MPPKASVAHQPSASPPPPGSSDAQDLLIIQDFMDTLDQIPPELTRVHSDLNELGAVLYSTLQNLEVKLNTLINWVQDPSIGVERRFQLLQEIAEEAARYKLGGDDKIRVAGGACDGIMAHQRHISNLLTASTLLQAGPLSPYTQSLTLANIPPTSNTRRGAMRANNSPFTGKGYSGTAGGGALGLEGREHPTPTKKKKSRVQQLGAGRDDDDVSSVGGDRKRAPVKKKRSTNNRAPSPTESTGSGYGQAPKSNLPMTDRQRAAAVAKQQAKDKKPDDDSEEEDEDRRNGQAMRVSPSAESNAREGNGEVRQGRVSRVRAGTKRSRAEDDEDDEDEDEPEDDVKPPTKRTNSNKKTAAQPDEVPLDHEDPSGGDGERLYCTCQAVSYGEMIGCDNEDCEIEWFHLACLGLDKTPEGTWYCPYCIDKFSKVPKKKAPPKSKARK